MSNTVQAAAEGLPSDAQIAAAMNELESDIIDLYHMASILTDQLGAIFNRNIIATGTTVSFQLERDQVDRFMFATYDVDSRCRELRAKFRAATNGQVLS